MVRFIALLVGLAFAGVLALALFGTALRDAVQGTQSVPKRRRAGGVEHVPASIEVVASRTQAARTGHGNLVPAVYRAR